MSARRSLEEIDQRNVELQLRGYLGAFARELDLVSASLAWREPESVSIDLRDLATQMGEVARLEWETVAANIRRDAECDAREQAAPILDGRTRRNGGAR